MIVIAAIVAFILILAIRGLGVMLLWNYVVAGVLGLPELSFWESVAAFMLVIFLSSWNNKTPSMPIPKKADKK